MLRSEKALLGKFMYNRRFVVLDDGNLSFYKTIKGADAKAKVRVCPLASVPLWFNG